MPQLVMVIDQKRCIGCHSCSIACKLENNLPKDMFYTRVYTNRVAYAGENELGMDEPEGSHVISGGGFVNTPDRRSLMLKYYTKGCQQCAKPLCVDACPYEATYKREKDGVVIVDYDKCIGCGQCVTACPYNARVSVTGDEEYYKGAQDTPVGGQGIPPHKKNTVEKCTFCSHRLDAGLKPACIEACPARARFIGEEDNPSNEIYPMLNGAREKECLLPEKNTEPSVYFLK